ncbi:MAG: hypothetical protein ROR55_23845 [Devosia sp.]
MSEIAAFVENIGWVRTLRTSPILYPLTNGGHILAFGTMIGALAVHHIALLRGRADASVVRATLPLAYAAFATAILTGAALVATQLGQYVANPAMQVKAGLMLLALVNVALFRTVRGEKSRRIAAATSLALWVCVLMSGRWVGFI